MGKEDATSLMGGWGGGGTECLLCNGERGSYFSIKGLGYWVLFLVREKRQLLFYKGGGLLGAISCEGKEAATFL